MNIFKSGTLAQIEAEYQKLFSKDERLKQIEQKFKSIMQVSYKAVKKAELRAIEKYLYAIMLIIDAIYNKLNKLEKKKKVDIPKDDLAFIFLIHNFFLGRYFNCDATLDKFAGFVGNYEMYIDNASTIVSKIKIHGKDANKLIAKLKKDADRIWYCDIPYSETDISSYSSDWFDEVQFADALGKSKGDYIVASRYNICGGREGGLDTIKKDGKTHGLSKKQKNIIKFFLRFVSEEFAMQYEQDIKDNSTEEENEKPDYTGENPNPWSHMSDGRTAKYIVFAFSNTEQLLGEEEKTKCVKNHLTVSVDSIRRMLKNTQISNISVEIMLTNMELDINMLPVKRVKDGIWYVPSFKTSSNYQVEPVTIIMDYELFVKEMVLFNISESIYKTSEERNLAAYLRDKYRKWGTLTRDKQKKDS